MQMPIPALCGSVILPLFLGCASSSYQEWIPQETLSKVESGLTFGQLKESPEAQEGKTILVGGEVLMAKRMPDKTRLMILQLPLDTYYEPVPDRLESQGRFIAEEFDFLDPAIVSEGTRITIAGTVSGSRTEPLDEMDYTYPTITIEHLKIWPHPSDSRYRYYPYPYPPYWYGPYYWHPYYFGPYGRPYYFW